MNDPVPDQTPFEAVSATTNKYRRQYQALLDQTTPFISYRWSSTGGLFVLFALRILIAEGWYIVAYSLAIYLLNLFLAFLTPKFDPSLDFDNDANDSLESARSPLPVRNDEEFRPFVRRLPEFKFWYSTTRAILIAFTCSWFSIFDVPVFWPVLVLYWLILFFLTMRRQIQHMIKYRYLPFTTGKKRFGGN